MTQTMISRSSIGLSDHDYEATLRLVASAARLTMSEMALLRDNPVARLLAYLPFRASSVNPDLVAVHNIAAYVMGIRSKEYFSGRASGSLTARLALGLFCPDGDPEVISAGQAILESVSLNDHKRAADSRNPDGRTNPIVIGTVDYGVERRRIRDALKVIQPVLRRELEAILPSACDRWVPES